jgi:acyl-CoA thioesterase-1
MMRRKLHWSLVALLVLGGAPAGTAQTTSTASAVSAAPPPALPCPAPDTMLAPDWPMPAVARAIRNGRLDILAVGSASTIGRSGVNAQDATPTTAYPWRMLSALRAALPHVSVQLRVVGGRHLSAEAMQPLLQEALIARPKPALVIWQTGTVETVDGVAPDDFADTLRDGTDIVAATGADLVLIDQQFSRFLRAHADVDTYRNIMIAAAGARQGVSLFRRYEIMQSWVEDEVVDLETAPPEAREATMRRLNSCLGAALAQFVLNGAKATPAASRP